MKKNGFTLVELVISITLLSIVLIFMMGVLVDLKQTEEANGVNTKLLVNQAVISKQLNNDFLEKKVSSITQNSTDNYSILFKDGITRVLSLTNSNKTLLYKEGENVIFRRTLAGGNQYQRISYDSSVSNLKILKIEVIDNVLSENLNYDIEAYYYGS